MVMITHLQMHRIQLSLPVLGRLPKSVAVHFSTETPVGWRRLSVSPYFAYNPESMFNTRDSRTPGDPRICLDAGGLASCRNPSNVPPISCRSTL
ncbi:protein of unknown function [Methylocaldum szegediense]|uniref:Uncharacterized protein n=1 Tax=Methylocaldum szegediense TaxID=73780 RepID=A0ABN8X1X0_9GAMM|nr:protein of unknown function [Methylocaldum szegediense]